MYISINQLGRKMPLWKKILLSVILIGVIGLALIFSVFILVFGAILSLILFIVMKFKGKKISKEWRQKTANQSKAKDDNVIEGDFKEL